MLKVWKPLLKYMKKYSMSYTIALVSTLIMTLVDSLYPLLTQYAIDTFIEPKNTEGFTFFGIFVLVVVTVQSIACFWMIRGLGKPETGVPADLRNDCFEKLQTLSLSYYNNNTDGWILSRITSDVRKLGYIFAWGMMDSIWALSIIVIMGVSMFILNWKLALITVATLPFLVIVSWFFQKVIIKTQRKVRKYNSSVISSYNEGINGAKTIKTLVTEDKTFEEFSSITEKMKKYCIKSSIVYSTYTPIVVLIGTIGTAFVLIEGGFWVTESALSLGTLAAFINYTTQFFSPIQQLAAIFNEFQSSQAAAERVVNLLDEVPEVKDSAEVIAKYGSVLSPKKELWPSIHGDIKFENVSFKYEDDEDEVLSNFSLDVKAGETIAIVGETGSGKTTIVNLACRFFEPTEGKIYIDGTDYTTLPMLWLQSNLGYVLQDPHLFSGSIKDNIIYTNTTATMEDVITAAKLVNAHEFIMKTENGYDTDVGERGGRLSAGQRQLISFARAILGNPKIFILDEATSSVDTQTENSIQQAVDNILKNRTSFIIAHRLSTIKSADRILVLEGGKILEAGTHEELMEKKGKYYSLVTI